MVPRLLGKSSSGFLQVALLITLPACGGACEDAGCEANYDQSDVLRMPSGRHAAAWAASEGAAARAEGAGVPTALTGWGEEVLAGAPGALVALRGAELAVRDAGGDVPAAFGASLRYGDVNADGRGDLLAGEGDTLYLVRSAARRADWSALGGDARWAAVHRGDGFGSAIWACGDLSGDGLGEWVIAAPALSASDALPLVPRLAGGVALLWSEQVMTAAGEQEVQTWLWGEELGARAGTAAACGADLTGDGIPDLVVGAPFDGAGDEGVVYLLDGAALSADRSAGSLGARGARWWVGTSAGAWAGAGLASGDLTGDGVAELVVGSPGEDARIGVVRVFSPATGRVLTAIRASSGYALGAHLDVGDVDGDGLADLAVGMPAWEEGGHAHAGRLGFWYGGGDWPVQRDFGEDEHWALVGDHAYAEIGALWHVWDHEGGPHLLLTERRD